MSDTFRFVRRPNAWKRRIFSRFIRVGSVSDDPCCPSLTLPARINTIAFTFDDGPDAVETPLVLDCLQRHGITATFFLLGRAIAGKESLVRRIVDGGHTLGNHTFSHPRFARWDFRTPTIEMTDCQRAIHAACGIEPRIARPPYGRCTAGYLFAAKRQQLRVQTWTLDSGDWQCRSEADAMRCGEEVRTAMRPGDTILFHDNHRWIVPILETITAPSGVFFGGRNLPGEP